MKLLSIESLSIPEIRVLTYGRFFDDRGFFTEPLRTSDFISNKIIVPPVKFLQMNESFSKVGVVRGLHFQWNPFMGKLVRTLSGHMIDLILDIRRESQTFGAIVAYDMPFLKGEFDRWIWVPPGFAHGNFFLEETRIEYICTGEYNNKCEACISPLAKDINWSLCDVGLRKSFDMLIKKGSITSDKDKNAMSLSDWEADPRSKNLF